MPPERPRLQSLAQGNPNPAPSPPQSECEASTMAYQCADPAPFIPRGLIRIDV